MKTRGHMVQVADPSATSFAALVLLTRGLSRAERMRWFAFRDEILDEAEARDGVLVCHYCHRNDLTRELPEGVRKSARLATIDHVVPLSKGGGRFDRKNCVVACYACNQRKADKLPV